MAEARSSGRLPIGYMSGSPIYESPFYVPTYPYVPAPPAPTPRSLPTFDVSIPISTTPSSNAEDETPFYSTSTVSPVYIPKSPIYIPTAINQPTYDVPTTTTANRAQGPPPPSTTTTPKAFKMQAQAYNSQQHNHQCGEGEEQPMKKPSSSGAVPPMPPGLGCIEEQPRIPFPSFINVVLDSDFTVEEREIYNKIVCESDGFDCPYVRPGINVPGMLKPYPLEKISVDKRMEIDYMADLALKHYNDLNGSPYQLVEVIKATLRFSVGCIFNITLRAKDDKSGSPPQNFQARVYDSMGKYMVLFCRVEGNADMTTSSNMGSCPNNYLQFRNKACWCGMRAAVRISESDRNPGRLYYECPKEMKDEGRCNYWKWCNPVGYHPETDEGLNEVILKNFDERVQVMQVAVDNLKYRVNILMLLIALTLIILLYK